VPPDISAAALTVRAGRCDIRVKKLYEIRDRAMVLRRRVEMIIAQPGMSVRQASTQQLDLLASTQAYLKTTINAP
jgi:hypothetical protein